MGRWVKGLVVALVLVGCATNTGGTVETTVGSTGLTTNTTQRNQTSTPPTTGAPATTTSSPAPDTTAPAVEGCRAFTGEPFQNVDTVQVNPVSGAEEAIGAVVYPHPDYEGNPWSQWGQGIVTSDGRFYSAIGDHLGAEGNSYIYEFDPVTASLTRIADVASLVDGRDNDWGHGKIHAQMVAGPCGEIYAATYWGSRRGIESADYSGGVLLRIDPASRTIENLGAPVPGYGIPSLASWPEGGLIYGEAADPNQPTGTNSGPFFVYDVAQGEVIFSDADPAHDGFRSIAVGPDGTAYVTFGEGSLSVYDPDTNTLVDSVSIPGGRLRAAAAPAEDGTIFAAADRPDAFFSIGPDGAVSELGTPQGYTASMVVDDHRNVVYSVPGAHGSGYAFGTPIVELDPSDGSQSHLVELAPPIESALGLRVGGTYGIAIDQSARTLFLSLNAGARDSRDTFGEVVFVEVMLP